MNPQDLIRSQYADHYRNDHVYENPLSLKEQLREIEERIDQVQQAKEDGELNSMYEPEPAFDISVEEQADEELISLNKERTRLLERMQRNQPNFHFKSKLLLKQAYGYDQTGVVHDEEQVNQHETEKLRQKVEDSPIPANISVDSEALEEFPELLKNKSHRIPSRTS